MKHYLDYLPDYLGGKNIEAHSQVIDYMNLSLNDNATLLTLWNKLERPIIIERTAESQSDITYKVHIKTPDSIKSITVTGDYDEYIEYMEEDLKEEDTLTFNYTITGRELNATFIVMVETYDEVIYTKGYPENDTVQNDVFDHDEFLTNLGTLMSVPRRIYTEYNYSEGASATPPYFAKQIKSGVVKSCTEDDYYLLQRILYFIENYQTKTLPEVMLYLRYGYEDVIVMNSYQRRNDPNLTERLRRIYEENLERYQAGTYIIIVPKDNPVNIQNLTEEAKKEFISLYCPITRQTTIPEPINTRIATMYEGTPYDLTMRFNTILIDTDDEDIMEELPIRYDVDGQKEGIVTAENPYQIITVEDFDKGYHYLNEYFDGFLEYAPAKTSFMFKTLRDLELPYDSSLMEEIGMENGGMWYKYLGYEFDSLESDENIKVVFNHYGTIGYYYPPYILNSITGTDHTVRLYKNYEIRSNGIPLSQQVTDLDAGETTGYIIPQPWKYLAIRSELIVVGIERSQLDSVPIELFESINGINTYTARFRYERVDGQNQRYTIPTSTLDERTWQIDLTSTGRVKVALGTPSNPTKYSITLNPEGRKKINFKLINGTIYVYDDHTYTGTKFRTFFADTLYPFAEVPESTSTVYDIAYADVTDIQKTHSINTIPFIPLETYQIDPFFDSMSKSKYYTLKKMNMKRAQRISITFSMSEYDSFIVGLGEIHVSRDETIGGNPIDDINLDGFIFDAVSIDAFETAYNTLHTITFIVSEEDINVYWDGSQDLVYEEDRSYTLTGDEDFDLVFQFNPDIVDIQEIIHHYYE